MENYNLYNSRAITNVKFRKKVDLRMNFPSNISKKKKKKKAISKSYNDYGNKNCQ